MRTSLLDGPEAGLRVGAEGDASLLQPRRAALHQCPFLQGEAANQLGTAWLFRHRCSRRRPLPRFAVLDAAAVPGATAVGPLPGSLLSCTAATLGAEVKAPGMEQAVRREPPSSRPPGQRAPVLRLPKARSINVERWDAAPSENGHDDIGKELPG